MPKPRVPDDDDDFELSRQETVVEKSDAMAREYSASREIRLREERVRRLSIEPAEPRRPSSERRERSARPSSGTSSRRERGSERGTERISERVEAEPQKGGARISDPFPPLRQGRPSAKERGAPLPRAEPVAPTPPAAHRREAPTTSSLDLLAMELEELLRELRHGWRNLGAADRTTLSSAVFVIAGVFMPWVSDPAHSLELGLFAGGVVHLALAVAAIAVIVKGTPGAFGGIGGPSRKERAFRHRRASLWLVLLGAASTFLGALLLLVYGLQKGPDWEVQLHFGFYWTLAAGTGLSYGGFARFRRRDSSDL